MDNKQRELLESSLFSRLWQNSPDNMFVVRHRDGEFYVVTSNMMQQEKAELRSPSIPDIPLSQLLPSEVYQPIEKNYLRCLSARAAIQYEEAEEFSAADSSPTYWSTTLNPMLNEQGEVELIFGVSRNISDVIQARKTAEIAAAKAEQANRVKTNFLANMSHEMRTPLNGIKGALELIRCSNDNDEVQELLTVIEHSANALSRQTEDVLDYSKLSNNKLKLVEQMFSVQDLLTTSMALLQTLAQSQGNQLELQLSDQIPARLLGDPDRIQQVLLNLGNNANKFTEHGQVRLRVEHLGKQQHQHRLVFCIEDSGVGIQPDDMQRLFKPFSQLDDSTTRKFSGTGLGLAICKDLVELMGGRIEASSTPGQGSVFTFTLTLSEPQACELQQQQNGNTLSLAGKQLLVVEDNHTNQLIVRKILEKADASVTIADNGRQALERCRDNHFDLILMDWHMPEMDGLEATCCLRRMAGFEHTPVLGLTANVMDSDREKCLLAGMNEVITKPVSRQGLLQRVAHYCQLSH